MLLVAILLNLYWLSVQWCCRVMVKLRKELMFATYLRDNIQCGEKTSLIYSFRRLLAVIRLFSKVMIILFTQLLLFIFLLNLCFIVRLRLLINGLLNDLDRLCYYLMTLLIVSFGVTILDICVENIFLLTLLFQLVDTFGTITENVEITGTHILHCRARWLSSLSCLSFKVCIIVLLITH